SESGHAVAVHGCEQLGAAGEVAVGSLVGEQELKAALDDFAMLALQMRFSGAEEGEKGEAGDAHIGFRAGAAAVLSENRTGFAASTEGIGTPAAIFALCRGEPVQGGSDGGL